MSALSPPPAKRNRVRSASQLEQKRLTDRLKHRENRQENKNRLEKIEGDVADIKATLQGLALHLQSQAPPQPPSFITSPDLRQLISLETPAKSSNGALHDGHTSVTPPFLADMHLWPENDVLTPQPPWSSGWSWGHATPELWTRISVIEPKVINCQCGSQHLDRFDTIDQCTMTTLYQRQIAFSASPNQAKILPRTPSIPSMMLHTMDENIATFLITGFLRQYRNKGIEQLLSFYLLGYRHMRWLMNPCDETLRDVPAWLLPTQAQRSNPHPVIVDHVPWPRLRDHLCTSGDENLQLSIHFYFESMEFLWPPGRPIFAQGDGGQMALSLEFEVAVGTLEHWRIGPPWSDAFPHLMHLVDA